jgi:hypothetical protein
MIFFCNFVPMNKLRRIFSLFLATIFLVSSLGFTANKMVCLSSGKYKLSAVQLEDCCKKEEPVTSIKSVCCDITNTYFGLADFNAGEKLQINQAVLLLPFMLSSFHEPLLKDEAIAADFSKRSWCSSGTPYLTFISVLRV